MSDKAKTGGAPRARGRPHLAAGAKIQRASDILKLEPGARVRLIESMTPLECSQLYHDWAFWARSDQAPPPGDWIIWLILAGRGAGKTRAGAEAVRLPGAADRAPGADGRNRRRDARGLMDARPH
jgi:hypothetical protein